MAGEARSVKSQAAVFLGQSAAVRRVEQNSVFRRTLPDRKIGTHNEETKS